MKKINVIFIMLLFIMPASVKASDIEIITYNSNIEIKQNRTVEFEEKCFINFLESKNEIEKGFLTSFDYNDEKINLKVLEASSLYVDSTFENNILNFKTDGSKGTVGLYTNTFTYDYGKDLKEGKDDLYLYIIDGEYNANISQINFTINMPENTTISDISFYINGSKDKEALIKTDGMIIDETGIITFRYENDTLIGSVSKYIDDESNVSMYISLRDNFFVNESDIYNLYWMIYLLILPILGLALGIVCWIKYGIKRKNKKNKIEIDLNNDIKYTSAEISFMYKGIVKEQDLVSVLLELANDNYITITEEEDGYKLGKNNTFIIKKIKDYEDNNAIKKIFFDKLFFDKEEISVKDIEYNLYLELVQAKNTLSNSTSKKMLFNEQVPLIKNIILGFITISLLVFSFYPSYLLTGIYFMFPLIALVMFLGIYILFMYDDLLLGKIMFGGIIIGGMDFLLIRPLLKDTYALIIFCIGSFIIYLTSFIYNKLSTRTKKGNEYYNIANEYKEKLLKLNYRTAKENNSYFYKWYSYVCIFDIHDEWNSKFRNIIKKAPKWYITNEEFSIKNYENFVKNMIYVITQAMYKNNGFAQSSTHVEYDKKINIKQME